MAEPVTLTPEQKAAMEKETAEQLAKIAEQQKAAADTAALERAREEGRKEAELAAALKAQKEMADKLAAELEAQKKAAEAREAEFNRKIADLTTSKQRIDFENPFKPQTTQSGYEQLISNPKLYREMEEKLRNQFFQN